MQKASLGVALTVLGKGVVNKEPEGEESADVELKQQRLDAA